jgi:hypothetical protein
VRLVPGLAAGALLALPASWLALRLNAGAEAAIVAEANRIYVFERLKHHLVPQQFKPEFVARHLVLVAGWALLCASARYDAGQRRLRFAVTGAIGLSALGLVVALATAFDPLLAARGLRFYWFRLGDALVPLGVAVVGTAAIERLVRLRPGTGRLWLGAAVAVAALHLGSDALHRVLPTPPRGDLPGKVADYDAWRDACAWIARNTPRHARFLTPRMAQTFKWHAARPEVVTWKDVPQDAAGIVEWWRRMKAIHWVEGRDPDTGEPTGQWRRSLAELDPPTLHRLGATFDAQYLLTESQPVLDLPLKYRNGAYAVYELRP